MQFSNFNQPLYPSNFPVFNQATGSYATGNMFNGNGMNQFANMNTPGSQAYNMLIRVTGIDGAKAFQMPPNSVVPLFDSDNDILYVKSTDGAGFPTIRTFAFTPLNQESAKQNAEFVTVEEFNQFKQEVLDGKFIVREQPTAE